MARHCPPSQAAAQAQSLPTPGSSTVLWYVMGSGVPGDGGNVWAGGSFAQFTATTNTSWFLAAGGQLVPQAAPAGSSGATTWLADPAQPVPTLGGNVLTLPQCGPHDQRPVETNHSVSMALFDSAPLLQPLHVHGRVSAQLWVSSSAVDTDVMVKITDVYPSGQSMLLQDGALRLRWRDGPSVRAAPLVPGQAYLVSVDLGWTSYWLSTGHRLRVALSSSNAPRFSINPNNGDAINGTAAAVVAKNSVWHDATHLSHLTLPTLPADALRTLVV